MSGYTFPNYPVIPVRTAYFDNCCRSIPCKLTACPQQFRSRCNACQGDGWTIEPDPTDGTAMTAMQVPCQYCYGTGKV